MKLFNRNKDKINKNKFEIENEKLKAISTALKNTKSFPYEKNTYGSYYGKKRKKINIPAGISQENAKSLYETNLSGAYVVPYEMDNGPDGPPCSTNYVDGGTAFLSLNEKEHSIKDNITALRKVNKGHSAATDFVKKIAGPDISHLFQELLPTALEMTNTDSDKFGDREENKSLIEDAIVRQEQSTLSCTIL